MKKKLPVLNACSLFCFFVLLSLGCFAQQHTVSGFTPSNAAAGETVTISGTNFSAITAVNFGGTAAASFTVVSPTKITAVMSGGTAGTITVVKTGFTTATSSASINFSPIPTVTAISTDFGGFWNTNTTVNNPTWPNDSHNLLSFTYGGITYSTGVNDARLSSKGITYSTGDFKALPAILNGTTLNAASLYIAAASKIDGNVSVGLYSNANIKNLTIQNVLTDGINGLNLGTGYTNLPASATSNFTISNIVPGKISDNEPDIVITQIADPATTGNLDTYKFLDGAGNQVGTTSQDMNKLSVLGTYYLDLFIVNTASSNSFATAKPTGVFSANGTRTIRFIAFKLSDFGITGANYTTVKSLQIIPSGSTDVAFVAYNANAVNVPPAIAQNRTATTDTICTTGGSAYLAVSGTAAESGSLGYSWEVSANGGTTWAPVTNGGVYSGATTNGLTISSATAGYKYRATVTESGNSYPAVSSVFTINTKASSALAGTLNPTTFSVCLNANSGTTALSVAPTGGTGSYSYQWSSSATSGGTYTNIDGAIYSSYSPDLSIAGITYYKLFITSGCLSNLSAFASVTINGSSITGVTNGSVCTPGPVALSATASGGTFNWYAASTGGSSLGTAATYNTPSISVTTTYYVTTTSASCESQRSPVLATAANTISLSSSNFNIINASPACAGSGSTITVTSSALSDGSYTANYNISGSNTVSGATAALTITGGTGTFATGALSTAGSNTITVTGIVLNGCTITPASGNTSALPVSPVAVGGTISGSTTVCSGANSTLLTLSGYTSAVTKWQSSAVSDFSSGVTDIANTTATLTATNLTATTYFRAVVSSGACTAANSASIAITATNLNTFSGTGNWANPALWSAGAVPVSGVASDVIVIASGATVTLNANYTVAGSFTMNATSALIVDTAYTLSVSSCGTAALNGQPVTFKSAFTVTASLGKMLGSLTGATNVTVERYIPNNGFRSWRLLSVPTYGNGQTIRQAWQEGDVNTSTSVIENNLPNYGTQITSKGALATARAAGFDSVTTSVAMQRYINDATWSAVTSTLDSIATTKGYFIYLRGDRSKGVTGLTSNSSATTLRTKGTVYQGNQATTIPANKYGLVGNTYPSAIDFTQLTRSDSVSSLFYIWDSKKLNGSSLGMYQTFSATNSYNCIVGGGSYTLGQPNTVIQSGQAFFVHTTGAAGTITLTENSKIGNSGALGFRPVTPPANLVKIDSRLYNLSGSGSSLADANVVVFDNAYSNAVDGDDAAKFANSGENLGIKRNNKILVVEGRQPLSVNDTIYYNITNMQQMQYQLEFVPNNLSTSGFTGLLLDGYLNTETPVNLFASSTINFSVNANAASSVSNRFRMVFKPLTPLAVSFISIGANSTAAGIKVDWKVAAETGILHYEVERSADGSNFKTIGTITAAGNTSAAETYSWTDVNANAGTLYYRIKSVSQSGEFKYTRIVKLATGNSKPGISVSPNPVEGGTVNLLFRNEPEGRYTIMLLSASGQVAFTGIALHTGGSSTQSMVLPAGLARGTYHIEISAPDMTRTVQKLFISSAK